MSNDSVLDKFYANNPAIQDQSLRMASKIIAKVCLNGTSQIYKERSVSGSNRGKFQEYPIC